MSREAKNITPTPLAPPVDRREFLTAGLVATAALGGLVVAPASALGRAADEPAARRGRTRVLRFAHMTDVHIQPERGAAEGFASALRHAQSLEDPAQFIVTGGDLVMDSFEADEARTKTQWDLWSGVLKGECSVPIMHTLGNHDIWGWNKKESKTTGDESRWGKSWAREVLGLKGDYQTAERAGWKFISLDSVRPSGADGYTAHLDDAQLAWLAAELASTDPRTPIIIVSHVPMLTVTTIADDFGGRRENNNVIVRGDLMHADSGALCALLKKHPNVKLCLSGHMHLLDRIEWRGITFICDGAVSGNWWKGSHRGIPEGYGLVDLYDDGSFEWKYVTYGWRAREA